MTFMHQPDLVEGAIVSRLRKPPPKKPRRKIGAKRLVVFEVSRPGPTNPPQIGIFVYFKNRSQPQKPAEFECLSATLGCISLLAVTVAIIKVSRNLVYQKKEIRRVGD